MPLPALPAVVAAAAALLARLAPLVARLKGANSSLKWGMGIAAAVETGRWVYEDSEQFINDVKLSAAALILERTGLVLHSDDPFSDASLSEAVGDKFGITIRTLKDKQSIEEDLLSGASGKIGERTGLYFSNLKDPEAIKKDTLSFASVKVMERTGIPISDITDIEKTKVEVKEWAITQAYQYMASDASVAQGMFSAAGVDVDAVVKTLNGQLKEKDGAAPLNSKAVLGALVQTGLLQQLARIGAKVAVAATKTRRQAQLAAASQRFREKHGSRQVYVRVSEPMPFLKPKDGKFVD